MPHEELGVRREGRGMAGIDLLKAINKVSDVLYRVLDPRAR